MHPILPRDERGMTTAEYSVGTLAAVVIAGVLLRLAGGGDGGWLADLFRDIIGPALDPTRLLGHLIHDGPFAGIR